MYWRLESCKDASPVATLMQWGHSWMLGSWKCNYQSSQTFFAAACCSCSYISSSITCEIEHTSQCTRLHFLIFAAFIEILDANLCFTFDCTKIRRGRTIHWRSNQTPHNGLTTDPSQFFHLNKWVNAHLRLTDFPHFISSSSKTIWEAFIPEVISGA